MTSKSHRLRFAVCVDDGGDAVSLELCKVYRLLADPRAEKVGLVRVIDESGEDYLYPCEAFVPIDLPDDTSRLLARIGRLQRRG
jgi:hypothetical protein